MSSSEGSADSGERGGARGKAVSLKELADHLGLSPATVSLVLNGSPVADSIPDSTKKRVFEAARDLNYRPNYMARSLRKQRSFLVGVLVPEITEGYAAGVIIGIERTLRDEGYFYLMAGHRSRSDLLEEYVQLFKDWLVEGFLVVNTEMGEAPGLPTVAVSGHTRLEGIVNVQVDHDAAARLALGHLAELGHRRIAFFKGHPGSADTEDRWRAIHRAAESQGLEVSPELSLQLSGDPGGETFSPEEGYEEGYAFGRKLLDRGVEFTALFAFNDVSAIGSMRAFLDAGLRVPQDVSVVGFDDIQSAAFLSPSLTTVRQPLRQMGETAARILLDRLSGEAPGPEVVTVEPELMVRESTGPPSEVSWRGRLAGQEAAAGTGR